MKVLIACEESQRVCTAFRDRGHEAYSCDVQEPCEVADISRHCGGNGRTVGRFRMSIFYFILRLFVVDDCVESAIVNALLCISDALWSAVLGKIFGWW